MMEVGPKNIKVGPKNIVQDGGAINWSTISSYLKIPCVVHTLNLSSKNICASKNVENKSFVFNHVIGLVISWE